MTNERLYQAFARTIEARANCAKSGNTEWFDRWTERLDALTSEYMPSGSGIDNGCRLDLEASTANKLVFDTAFHHMIDGMYDGWTEHRVIVTPSLTSGADIRITGRDRNEIKDYLAEVFQDALTASGNWVTPSSVTVEG